MHLSKLIWRARLLGNNNSSSTSTEKSFLFPNQIPLQFLKWKNYFNLYSCVSHIEERFSCSTR